MVVRVLQGVDAKTHGPVVHVTGVGLCQVVDDDAGPASGAQLTTWLAAARAAALTASLLCTPRLKHVNQSPDGHVYLALDGNGRVAAQITSS